MSLDPVGCGCHRIERSLQSQAVETEPKRVAVTLARWCIATIKEMRRHRHTQGKHKVAQNVAKQLALARQKLQPLYPSLVPAQTCRGDKALIQLDWGIDCSRAAILSEWSALESDLGRVTMGLVSDVFLW